ncbi:MAG: hypothetical protein K0S65_4811 [Labilithrix sp.]|nr:hypothetical protein [Labilithrix sp.]
MLVLVLVVFGLGGDWKSSIMRQSIETMGSSISLPCSCSSADKRLERFPLPFAMLSTIDWLASSRCLARLLERVVEKLAAQATIRSPGDLQLLMVEAHSLLSAIHGNRLPRSRPEGG